MQQWGYSERLLSQVGLDVHTDPGTPLYPVKHLIFIFSKATISVHLAVTWSQRTVFISGPHNFLQESLSLV